ncbi:oligosaccharide flippase family protein [Thaumasiovibrio subtropicus]|uniref:oligosaccharide flippase family protein n=2 Tax=Thaumasiovibrio subtropicus TaxID=1891207 RepID=UPI001C853A0F|nr:oligosaccharide flippase family protein [Thaumasiovibrio subtropicus]
MFKCRHTFLFLPILTRVLTADEYGELSLLMTVYALLLPILSIALPQYVFRSFFDSSEEFSSRLQNGLSTVLAWTAVGNILAISVSAAAFLLNFLSMVQASACIVIVVSASLNSLFQIRLLLFNAEGKAKSFVTFQISYSLLLFVITLASLFFLQAGSFSRVLGVLVADIIFAILAFREIKRTFGAKVVFPNSFSNSLDFLKFGGGLVPHLIASVLLSSLDKVIIASKMTMSDLAGYAIAVQFTSVLMIFTQGLSKEWSRYYLANRGGSRVMLRGLTLVGIISGAGVVIYLLKDVFFFIFVGDGFSVNPTVIVFLLIGQIFHSIYMIVSIEITYLKKTHILSSLTLLSLFLNLMVSFALVDSYGTVGVAIGTMTGMAAKLIVVSMFVLYQRNRLVEEK